MSNFITENNLYITNIEKKESQNNSEFLEWFVGFIDGEGCFLIEIEIKKKVVKFNLRINLHIDDLGVLVKIKENLGIGEIYLVENKNQAYWRVIKLNEIQEVIIPIFDKYPLLTIKSLNYQYFKQALNIKLNAGYKQKLSDTQFENIKQIKSKMNLNLDSKEIYKWNHTNGLCNKISPYWLLGFIEAEGSFTYRDNRPIFSISQDRVSEAVFHLISTYLEETLSDLIPTKLVDTKRLKVNIIKTEKVINLKISSIDTLIYLLIPFLFSMKFQSRKEIDFKLWAAIVILYYKGYGQIEKNLILNLINILNKRYSTSNKVDINIELSKINTVLNLNPYYNLKDDNHKSFMQLAAKKRFSCHGFPTGSPTLVYDNGILVQNFPFDP